MKKCCVCKHLKTEDFFNKKSSNKDGRERYCKECHREKNRAHYVANKAAYVATARKWSKVKKDWYENLKKGLKCTTCNEDKHWRLCFHHTDKSTKEFEISQMVLANMSKDRILKEIDKCVVLCQHCHLDLHYFEHANRGVA